MPWNVDQVLVLAPDPGSAKSGKELASPRKWKTLGATAACAWGEIQGSGKVPYQTIVDLGGPVFKCTCPSRKFPCKHGLGLFLILAQQPAAMASTEPPAWVSEWFAKRAASAEKKTAKASTPGAPPDAEAEAKAAAGAEKRAAAREDKITAGLADLGTWLNDLVRTGLAPLPGKPAGFWETPAARLVDAQAPGLARRVREMGTIPAAGEGFPARLLRELGVISAAGEDWPARLLRELSLLHLAREGWSRRDALPPATQADLRRVIGFTESKEDLLGQDGVRDRWQVLGQSVEEEERFRVQRVWLWGAQSGRPSLVLSVSAGPNQPLDTSLVIGTSVDAELAFVPSAFPLRAVVKQRHGEAVHLVPGEVKLPHPTIAAANAFVAGAWTANPWLEQIPVALAAVVPVTRNGAWLVRDAAGHALPLRANDPAGWRLAALSGGNPLALFGEWDGELLLPLSVWAEGRFLGNEVC